MHEIEVWVVIDEAGDYEVGTDEDQASENFDENIGGSQSRRKVCLKLKVPAPKPLVVEATIPEEAAVPIALEVSYVPG